MKSISLFVKYLMLILLSFLMVMPVLLMVVTSLKYQQDVFALPVQWIPDP
ncbi:hypothetical protein [Candidatus Contubernalis alkaliaceticus]|nr:hypothetical protein [Candidatus Contubernalis alkalaceticus]UNC90853.1 hypothetical protein HUE98_01385 [Candidatus Contubernalis alkalaceticus]